MTRGEGVFVSTPYRLNRPHYVAPTWTPRAIRWVLILLGLALLALPVVHCFQYISFFEVPRFLGDYVPNASWHHP